VMGEVWSPFADYGFMRRALAGCVSLSIGAAPLGTILLLRRMSLVGDAMSHAILPGAALGYLLFGLSLPAMTAGGLLAGLLVALLAGVVTRHTTLREDASFAACSARCWRWTIPRCCSARPSPPSRCSRWRWSTGRWSSNASTPASCA
jgi:ABC-type Mn2+/Zn2+ transport system permease subunit